MLTCVLLAMAAKRERPKTYQEVLSRLEALTYEISESMNTESLKQHDLILEARSSFTEHHGSIEPACE